MACRGREVASALTDTSIGRRVAWLVRGGDELPLAPLVRTTARHCPTRDGPNTLAVALTSVRSLGRADDRGRLWGASCAAIRIFVLARSPAHNSCAADYYHRSFLVDRRGGDLLSRRRSASPSVEPFPRNVGVLHCRGEVASVSRAGIGRRVAWPVGGRSARPTCGCRHAETGRRSRTPVGRGRRRCHDPPGSVSAETSACFRPWPAVVAKSRRL